MSEGKKKLSFLEILEILKMNSYMIMDWLEVFVTPIGFIHGKL